MCVVPKRMECLYCRAFLLTRSLIEWDDSSNFARVTRFCCLVLVHPCRIRNPLLLLVVVVVVLSRLLELLLGDCPKRMAHTTLTTLLPIGVDRAEYTHTLQWWCNLFCPLRRSLGRLSWWASNGNVCTYARHGLRSWAALHPYVFLLLVYLPMRQSYFFGGFMRRIFLRGLLYVRGCLRILPSGFCR